MNKFALARAKVKFFRFKPNMTELKLLDFLEDKFPGEFQWNGGQIQINGKVPDFYNSKHHVFLEYIGRKDFPKHEPEELEKRKKLFENLGFRVMYIHSEDLKDPDNLYLDILFFLHYNIGD